MLLSPNTVWKILHIFAQIYVLCQRSFDFDSRIAHLKRPKPEVNQTYINTLRTKSNRIVLGGYSVYWQFCQMMLVCIDAALMSLLLIN